MTDDPVIWYDWNPNGPAMLAYLSTTLALTDGCLTAQDGQLLAFPRALGSWNAEAGVLEYAGVAYAPGDTIVSGGGGASLTDEMTIPEGCDARVGDRVFLIQTQTLGDPSASPSG